jgi:hypothetical protein
MLSDPSPMAHPSCGSSCHGDTTVVGIGILIDTFVRSCDRSPAPNIARRGHSWRRSGEGSAHDAGAPQDCSIARLLKGRLDVDHDDWHLAVRIKDVSRAVHTDNQNTLKRLANEASRPSPRGTSGWNSPPTTTDGRHRA